MTVFEERDIEQTACYVCWQPLIIYGKIIKIDGKLVHENCVGIDKIEPEELEIKD